MDRRTEIPCICKIRLHGYYGQILGDFIPRIQTERSILAPPLGRLKVIPVKAEHLAKCVRTLNFGVFHSISEMLALNMMTVTSTVISSSVSWLIGSTKPSGVFTSSSRSTESVPTPQPVSVQGCNA